LQEISHRLKEFEILQKAYKRQNEHSNDIQILEKLSAITIKPIEIINFGPRIAIGGKCS